MKHFSKASSCKRSQTMLIYPKSDKVFVLLLLLLLLLLFVKSLIPQSFHKSEWEIRAQLRK